MSRLLCPILLIAGAAFPSAALALGLGELHVESALGQGFVAHIDLIDASPEDLARLQAAIADEDTFQRNQLERPGFLAGTTVSVGQDVRGQPILRLRSQDSFTEPVVTFLVDVHWRAGELIREYTALLDPAELRAKTPDAAAEAAAPALPTRATQSTLPVAGQHAAPNAAVPALHAPGAQMAPVAAAPAPLAATASDPKPQLRSYTVRRGDTLVRIAIIAGARSGNERHRMMIAIDRANPASFQQGLNILRTGEVLRLPSAEELAAISVQDADREYKARLAATPETARHKLRAHSSKHAVAVIESKADPASVEAEKLALRQRVESLEQSLQEVRHELQRSQPTATPARPVSAASSAPERAVTTTESSDDSAAPVYRRAWFIALIGGLGLMLTAGLWWAFGRRRDNDSRGPLQAASVATVAAESNTLVAAAHPSAGVTDRDAAAFVQNELLMSANSVATQVDTHDVNPPLAEAATAPGEPGGRADSGDTTAVLAPAIEGFGDTAKHKFSFYHPESHFDTTHVVMGSELTRPLAFVERRKHPAIVLQQAIEREPHRSDLHLKLLELYYASASENRLAFLEAARQIGLKQGLVSAEDWARIAAMGRQIAPDDELFRNELDDQAVA